MSRKIELFISLPIGSLFFRTPFDELENPSIKIATNQARKPNGETVVVNEGVAVFVHEPQAIESNLWILSYEELFDYLSTRGELYTLKKQEVTWTQ